MRNIILASSSPRRIEMMKNNGYNPEIMPAKVDETLPYEMTPESAVMYLAFKKAMYVKERVSENNLIIAADTVVVYDGKIIGKPENKDDAFNILSKLRLNHHYVITGVCIIDTTTNTKNCFYEITTVYFTDYTDEELLDYLDTDEPYDKAGAYAIQGTFSKYIDHFEGDYDNVVGFPWNTIKSFLN